MDYVYATGAAFIQSLQITLGDYENYFRIVNKVTNPNYFLNYIMPFISIFDSVFAAQLTWCMGIGNWLNAVMKWWLLEDRPYWWVEMTNFYQNEDERPVLKQNRQTCELGPGCPSGHSESMAIFLMLTVMWWAHVMNDLKIKTTTWQWIWFPFCTWVMISVMLARMIIAAHFPHQVVLGAMIGAVLCPFLCVYVTDPYIWQYAHHKRLPVGRAVRWHVFAALTTVAISAATYASMTLCGLDPSWTIKLAHEWCLNPDTIHVTTTPLYALAHSTGHLLGWAICVTPVISGYRYYTSERYLIVSIAANLALGYSIEVIHSKFSKDNVFIFYFSLFILGVVKVPLLLRVIPYLATYSYKLKQA